MDNRQAVNFLTWAQTVNPETFINEDDVETKFIIPLFELLGYQESHRRGKYPLQVYSPGKPGRKPEIDQVYFSVPDAKNQGPDTTLIVVEAKEPGVTDLSNAVQQGLFYCHYVKPVFLAATNGRRIVILKIQNYRQEETVIDFSISELANASNAITLYQQINFSVVSGIKERYLADLAHRQYSLMESALSKYPELEHLISEGDFSEYFLTLENKVVASTPKVEIIATLPVALRDGEWKIKALWE